MMRFASPVPSLKLLVVNRQPTITVVLNARARRTNLMRRDPTRTTLIRKKFMADIRRRFRALRRELLDFFIVKDALGQDSRNSFITMASPREFEFRTDAGKLQAFKDWFQQQVDANILSPTPGTPFGQPWTTTYVESAYKRGVLNAFISSNQLDLDLGDDDIGDQSRESFLRSAFTAPETLSKIQLLSTRTFSELEGVTAAMGTEMNRILAQSIADGLGAADTARALAQRLDSLTRDRAMTIARTELIHAHAEGQLDSFTRLGVSKLGVMAEWSTAGDDHVCPLCEEMEGKTFTIDEARGMIPLHPNCRCTWIPSV